MSYTQIEEDASVSDDEEKHLKISVADYLGSGSNQALNSYLNLGKWSPSASAGTVDTAVVGSESFVAAPSDAPEASFTHDATTGDDLLAPFVINSFTDDTRNRYDDAASNPYATPGTDYTKFAQPPDVSNFGVDGSDLLPEQTKDEQTGYYYYEKESRQKITKAIPKYVGWRDHTEGHRITTTRGDKIEVIGGNYKLIVLGRGAGTAQTEWSGGLVFNSIESPGNVTSINWRKLPTGNGEGNWQWVEETIKGNVIQRFHGSKREEIYGDRYISIVGCPYDAKTDGDASGPYADASAVTSDEDKGEWDDELDPWETDDNSWDSLQGTTFVRTRPKIVQKVYAAEKYSYERLWGDKVDVSGVPGTNDSEVWIDSYVGCRPEGKPGDGGLDVRVALWNLGKGDSYVTMKHGESLAKRPFPPASIDKDAKTPLRIRTTTKGETIRNHNIAKVMVEERECDLYIGNYMAHEGFGIHVEEYWNGNFFENYFGARESVFIGAKTEFCFSLYFSFSLAKLDIAGRAASVDIWKDLVAVKKNEITVDQLNVRLNKVEAELSHTKTGLVSTEYVLVRSVSAIENREP